jgi:hypothetical protein
MLLALRSKATYRQKATLDIAVDRAYRQPVFVNVPRKSFPSVLDALLCSFMRP